MSKVTKADVLVYIDEFQGAMLKEREKAAVVQESEGLPMLGAFTRKAAGCVYQSLSRDLKEMHDLVRMYGPDQVETREVDEPPDADTG